ncbi:hypothetical protein EGW08_010118 [Elysia chlorotica]|uniref:Reverse transcriptase domain-containing protein n=1 Tax=Elysia chlorotica TaxID=188477 RepID=A0A3S1C3N8_ELYCH|nr:hypothetical protein EGW08_010118 [Elysia chlorotica]
MEKIEWRHLKAIDRTGSLLQTVLSAVHTWGIPSSQDCPHPQEGEYRGPQQLQTHLAVELAIQALLRRSGIETDQNCDNPQTAIDEAKNKQDDLTIAWMDLTNAFGSILNPVLEQLFQILPISEAVHQNLTDIYTNNQREFVSRKTIVRNTTYAENLAVLGRTPAEVQPTLDRMDTVATKIGVRFNPRKCASLTFRGGMVLPRMMFPVYLGIPTGAKLLYRPGTDLPHKMNRLQESLLAPWQKLEALRSQLLPSLSHHLASGRVKKDLLRELDD